MKFPGAPFISVSHHCISSVPVLVVLYSLSLLFVDWHLMPHAIASSRSALAEPLLLAFNIEVFLELFLKFYQVFFHL